MRSRNVHRISLLLALAACTHVPPDIEARAGPPVIAPAQRRAPLAGELVGAWISVEVRGVLKAVGDNLVYVFTADGRYTGAAISSEECAPLAGAYVLENGAVLRIDGDLLFAAAFLGERLELVSDGSYLLLRRLDHSPPVDRVRAGGSSRRRTQ